MQEWCGKYQERPGGGRTSLLGIAEAWPLSIIFPINFR